MRIDEVFFELYRARPQEYPELVYEHMPESSASARNRTRLVPRSKYEAAGHYALVVYTFTHRSHNADPEWQLSAGIGHVIYFEVTE